MFGRYKLLNMELEELFYHGIVRKLKTKTKKKVFRNTKLYYVFSLRDVYT